MTPVPFVSAVGLVPATTPISAVVFVTVRSRVSTRSFTRCSVSMPLRISMGLHVLTRRVVFLTSCWTRSWAAAVFHWTRRCVRTGSAIAACFLVRRWALHAASISVVRTRTVVAHLASLGLPTFGPVRAASGHCVTTMEVCRTGSGCNSRPPVVHGRQKLAIADADRLLAQLLPARGQIAGRLLLHAQLGVALAK